MPIPISYTPVAYYKAQLVQAELAEKFVGAYDMFLSRANWDCRPVDAEGGRTPGEFLVGSPAYHRLQYGTAAECLRGLVYSRDNIRNFSTGFAAEPTVIPGDVYDWQNAEVGVMACSKIAIVKGHPSEEAAVFFFSLAGMSQHYLIVEVGGRYAERCYYFFEGDPDDLIRGRGRNPRREEMLKFESIREGVLNWPEFHYMPVELIAVVPEGAAARAPYLHEIGVAAATLAALGHLANK